MRRLLAAACVLVVALCAGAIAPNSMAEPASVATPPRVDSGNVVLAKIRKHRKTTWRWEQLMRVRRSRASGAAERTNDLDLRLRILTAWKTKAQKRARQVQNPPHKRAWLCIYRHERHPRMGWKSRTGNGFFGGLQMNLAFQRSYAPELLRTKGTADRWSPLEQIWVAVRAHRAGRGFHPWPNTARNCGLL